MQANTHTKTQAGGRVLIKQNTGHSRQQQQQQQVTANRKPRTQRERERGRRVSCIAHGAGAGATARPERLESPITHDAESTEKMAYMYPWGLALQRTWLVRIPEALRTKHKTRAGGRECRCKQNTKTQAGGRV
jgi:hypothetical protein